MPATLEPLPRAAVDVEKFLPTVIVDTREQTPLTFSRLPSVRAGLDTGDYSVKGLENLFAVERKSISDLVASVTSDRARFEKELCRMRGHRFARLLIVGSRQDVIEHRYQSRALPKSILNTLAAFEARYVPVVWTETPDSAAVLVEGWAWWFAREILKTANFLSP